MAPYGGAGFGPYVAFAPPLDQIESRIRQSDAYRQRTRTRSVKRHSSDAFVSTGKRLQLVERHMSQRLNKDRKVRMEELYDALYPVREVTVESSFQMSNPVGQKMTCMNVFRHQDLGVLDTKAATTAAMTSGTLQWDNAAGDQLTISGSTSLCQSGYVMRGYGVTLQNQVGSNENLAIQSQMHIGPGNHLPGLKSLGANAFNNLVGNRFNVDTSKFLSVFDGKGANDDLVRYPNLDQNQVGVSDIMGCMQTLWSPICAQSIEAASANLGFNHLGRGTVSKPTGYLDTDQSTDAVATNSIPFGPLPTDRTTAANPRRVPRDTFDAEGCKFTWNKHTAAYKFTNTYSYPLEVEVIVFKAHGLTSRQNIGTTTAGSANPFQTGQGVTEYYPGFNGPLPWSSSTGGIFNIIFGSYEFPANTGLRNKAQSANRIMALDFINSWTNHLGKAQSGREGIQLPEVDIPAYPNPTQGSLGRFQLSTQPHWPWTNARWRNWCFPKGGSDGTNFLREFSRKKIKIQPSEQVSLDLDLGGFKYALSDVGYLSKVLDQNTNPTPPNSDGQFKNLTWSVAPDATPSQTGNANYHFASKGLMNGSVVVSLTLKGSPCAANAPLIGVGPNYPVRTTNAGSPNGESLTLSTVPPLVDVGAGGGQDPVPPSADATPRGNYATGTVHSAGTLLVECKERVSFQPMMNKRPKFLTNNATKTNHSLLIQPLCPVDATIRTTDSSAVKTYTNTIVANTDADKTANT